MPKYLGEILSFIILFVLVILMITGGEVWYEISSINSYKSNVVKMAQRSSGFTPELRTQMNDLGNDYYGERMSVQPITTNNDPQNENDWQYKQVNYGHDIGFYIIPKISRFNQLFIGQATSANNLSDNQTYKLKVYVVSQARDNSFNYQ